MSWLARSLVNSLRGDDDDDSERNFSSKAENDGRSGIDDEPLLPSRGVKEDLSELTKTITRQFWGVASFLAPPPDIPPSDRSRVTDPSVPAVVDGSDESEVSESPRMAGIRSDFAELGGRFKSGISMLSNAKAVSEISKIASTFLPFVDEDAEEEDGEPGGEAVGIKEEVLLFVRNISMHPETWLDFPLIAEDEEPDDFEMSDAQQDHALSVERLEPRLAALRIELCPSHMSEGCFWKIYYVLLHSRLNKHDAELLSTPQIVEARAMLLQDLQRRRKPISEESAKSLSSEEKERGVACEGNVSVVMPASDSEDLLLSKTPPPAVVMDIEREKHPVVEDTYTADVKMVDKSVVIEEDMDVQADAISTLSNHKNEDYEDDWLEEEDDENAPLPLGNEEDVSFSDLDAEEDEHDHDPKAISEATPTPTPTQLKDSRGWVQLNNTNKDGWLNVQVDAAE